MNLSWMKIFKVKRTLPLLVAALLALAATTADAREHHSHGDNALIAFVSLDMLPPEARTTFQLIKQGGPFPFPRDGVVFGNFEKRLPKRPRGYYHEYTVKTPGVRSRGARRIVCGAPTECYYSDDHYETFKRIRE
ncbi:MAG TPA: ribonuclease [Gallionella sp.]|nr:ribonuclease [Gallionella sp.]